VAVDRVGDQPPPPRRVLGDLAADLAGDGLAVEESDPVGLPPQGVQVHHDVHRDRDVVPVPRHGPVLSHRAQNASCQRIRATRVGGRIPDTVGDRTRAATPTANTSGLR